MKSIEMFLVNEDVPGQCSPPDRQPQDAIEALINLSPLLRFASEPYPPNQCVSGRVHACVVV